MATSSIRIFKYVSAFLLPSCFWFGLNWRGPWTWAPVVFALVLIPVSDMIFGANAENLSKAEAEMARKDRWYDLLIYLTVPIHIGLAVFYLFTFKNTTLSVFESIGLIVSMGLMNGVFGINVAHELGHRQSAFEKVLAKTMLGSTLFLHFYIEHNRGHHRNVGTPDDPASAYKGESVYRFWWRTVTGSFASAWHIVVKERQRKKKAIWSLRNEMIQYMLIQTIVVLGVAYFGGGMVLAVYLTSALLGILLLETVNYIEHYGLRRAKVNEHRYEDVRANHSWNSDHVISRIVLFELTRHSDHHYDPSKPYQVLDSLPTQTQMPTGYAGMIIIALIPPVWFGIMDKRIPEGAIASSMG